LVLADVLEHHRVRGLDRPRVALLVVEEQVGGDVHGPAAEVVLERLPQQDQGVDVPFGFAQGFAVRFGVVDVRLSRRRGFRGSRRASPPPRSPRLLEGALFPRRRFPSQGRPPPAALRGRIPLPPPPRYNTATRDPVRATTPLARRPRASRESRV